MRMSISDVIPLESAGHINGLFQGPHLIDAIPTDLTEMNLVNGDTRFRLSQRGADEINLPSPALTQGMRRCLVLIDGVRTVRDLSHWLRANEINEVLAELERAQFIIREEDVGESQAISLEMVKARLEKLESIKSAAIADLSYRLGSTAAFVVAEIELCRSDMELRTALRSIEDVLVAAFGKTQALEFVKSVGGEVMEM
jgi:hypothetical protein